MNEANELDEFLKTILLKIGQESCTKIEEILIANNFKSRLSLKLLSPANLDALFADTNLPLGSRKVLEYHLNLLNDKSPLNTKVRQKKSGYAEQGEVHNSILLHILFDLNTKSHLVILKCHQNQNVTKITNQVNI
jgi:hypothetical protein